MLMCENPPSGLSYLCADDLLWRPVLLCWQSKQPRSNAMMSLSLMFEYKFHRSFRWGYHTVPVFFYTSWIRPVFSVSSQWRVVCWWATSQLFLSCIICLIKSWAIAVLRMLTFDLLQLSEDGGPPNDKAFFPSRMSTHRAIFVLSIGNSDYVPVRLGFKAAG